MTTKREYAADLGLAIAGARGRLSREANAAIDKAVAGGMAFDQPAYVKAQQGKTKRTAKPNTPKVVSTTRESGSVPSPAPRTSTDGTYWTAIAGNKKVRVDYRQVCTVCHVSLGWHQCNVPQAITAYGILPLVAHETTN